MVSPLLMVTAGALLVAAVLFAAVARTVSRRRYSEENRWAGFAILVAWTAIAVKLGIEGARQATPFFETTLGVDASALWLTLARVVILATAAMLWGFGYYVGFLWSGRARFNVPLMGFAASHALIFLYLIEQAQGLQVAAGTWSVRVETVGEPTMPAWFGVAVLVYFFLPIILIGIAYFALAMRLEDRLQRLRAGSVALTVIVVQGIGIYLANPRADPNSPLNPAAVLVLIVAAATALVLHRNPQWLRRRIEAAKPRPGPAKERA